MNKHAILLVDNNEQDVISFQRSLKKVSPEYDLYVARNGKEALTILNDSVLSLEPDVVILDLNMPKMNGIDLLKVLRADTNFNHLKVFIMTASFEPADHATIEELGVSGYLIKPLSYTDNTKRNDSMDSFIQFHLRRILSKNSDQ